MYTVGNNEDLFWGSLSLTLQNHRFVSIKRSFVTDWQCLPWISNSSTSSAEPESENCVESRELNWEPLDVARKPVIVKIIVIPLNATVKNLDLNRGEGTEPQLELKLKWNWHSLLTHSPLEKSIRDPWP